MNNSFIAYKLFCSLNGLSEGQYKNFKYFMEVENEH